MMVYAMWHGGHNYAAPYADQREELPSIQVARQMHADRLENRDGWTPGVDETSETWLFFTDPAGMDDVYPDRVIKTGPRGGVRVSQSF